MKTVLCLIEPRKKVIKFISRNDSSDYVALRQSFLEASEKDVLLKSELVGHTFIFQIMNPDLEDWCDLEEEDIIVDKSKIKVVLMQDLKSLKIGESIFLPEDSNNIDSIQEYSEIRTESSSAHKSNSAAQNNHSGQFDELSLIGQCSRNLEKNKDVSNLKDIEVR